MRYGVLILLLLGGRIFIPFRAEAAFEFKETGARALAMGGAFVAGSGDAMAPYWNPAGIRSIDSMQVASFYSQLFSVSELNYGGVGWVSPSPFGGLGLAYSQLGPPHYREQQLYFSHGFYFLDTIQVGYNIKAMFLQIEGFGSARTFGLDVGLLACLRKNFYVAVVSKNVNHPTIGQSQEALPRALTFGATFQVWDELVLSADWEQIDSDEKILKTGVEFSLVPFFSLRGGMQNIPSNFSGGVGFQMRWITLDYAYLYHSNLSGSHQFTLTFKIH